MVIGRICNAKELLIAVQEAFETLERVALSEDIDERDDEGSQNLCAPKQVVRLVQLYSQSEPFYP